MAGGTIYLEPILEELQDKISDLEDGMAEIKEAMAEIPAKLDEQIEELQKVVNTASSGINVLNIYPGDEFVKKDLQAQRYVSDSDAKTSYLFLTYTSFANGTINITMPMVKDSYDGSYYAYWRCVLTARIVDEDENEVFTMSLAEIKAGIGNVQLPTLENVICKTNTTYKLYIDATRTLSSSGYGRGFEIQDGNDIKIKYDIKNIVADGPFNVV